MLVNITTLLLQFEKCIVDDICDAGRQAARFFTFPRRGPQTKGLVKSADFPTQLVPPASPVRCSGRATFAIAPALEAG